MSSFKDHFSTQSAGYAAHRPTYPAELFSFLATLCSEHDLALDCATGSGQAARGLAAHFERVIATDASAEQIAAALPHAGVDYRVAPAEHSGLPARSVDLLCAAQAAHWFDLPAFHAEVQRVVRPGGLVALWCYQHLAIEPAIDRVILDFYDGPIGPYWPPERGFVERGYRDLDFPYAELPGPALTMTADWTLDQLLDYLGTWSAVKRYRQACGNDPLPALRESLLSHWVWPDAPKPIKWPLSLRLGRL